MKHVYRLGMLNDYRLYRIFDYRIKCSFSFVSHSILKILRSLLENALYGPANTGRPGLIQLFVLCLQPLDAAQVCLLRLPLPHSRPSTAGGTAFAPTHVYSKTSAQHNYSHADRSLTDRPTAHLPSHATLVVD